MYTSIHDIPLLLFVGGTETLLVHFAYCSLMRRNARSRVQYLIALAIYMACTMLDAWFNLPIYFVLSICYFLIAVIAFLFYDNSWEERLIIPFAYVAVNYAATIYATAIVHWLGTSGAEPFPEHLQQTFPSQALLFVLVVIFVYTLQLLHNAERPSVLLVFFVSFCTPFVTLLLLIHEFYLIPTSSNPDAALPQYLAIATLLLLTATTLYSLASRIGSLLRSIEYSDSLQQMLGVQERYYATLQEHQVELRQIYHDILNHSRTILKLLNSGLVDEARDYTSKLVSETESPLTVTECDNQLLGALLNDRLASAKRRGVSLHVCVMVPPVLEIDAVDVCILLSNLLDNASEACDRLQGEGRAVHASSMWTSASRGPSCVCASPTPTMVKWTTKGVFTAPPRTTRWRTARASQRHAW